MAHCLLTKHEEHLLTCRVGVVQALEISFWRWKKEPGRKLICGEQMNVVQRNE